MGCCCRHVIREGVALRNTLGVCLDMTMAGTPSPLAMEDDTGKGSKHTKAGRESTLRTARKGGPLSEKA